MTLNLKEERLTAWATGELSHDEELAFEAELQENPAALRHAEEVKQLADQLRAEFRDELPIGELICLPRPVRENRVLPFHSWKTPHSWIAAAAVFLGAFAVFQFAMETWSNHQIVYQQAAPRELPEIHIRLHLDESSVPRTLFAGGMTDALRNPISGQYEHMQPASDAVTWVPLVVDTIEIPEVIEYPDFLTPQRQVLTEISIQQPAAPETFASP